MVCGYRRVSGHDAPPAGRVVAGAGALRRTLDELGSELSEPVRLVYFSHLSQTEVATLLGVSSAQIKVRIALALKLIGDALIAGGTDG